jgi:protein-disulfide isomerase
METELPPNPYQEISNEPAADPILQPETADISNPASDSQSEPPMAVVETAKPKRGLRWLYWLPVAFALGMAAGYFAFAYPLESKLKTAQDQLASAQGGGAQVDIPEQVKRYDVPTDGNPSSGPEKAPITIIEFSDYQCPFCREWFQDTWPQIQKNYGDKVRLVYRDFPLYGIHANAEPAAEAARCAGDQGKYWEFHNAIFSSTADLTRDTFDSIAKDLKLDATALNKCIDAHTHKAEVENNYQYAAKLGVGSTPTFFINGLALVGAQPYEVFQRVIDLELSGKLPK